MQVQDWGHYSHRTRGNTTKAMKRPTTVNMTQVALISPIYGCPAPVELKLPLNLGASCTGYLRKFAVSFGYLDTIILDT